MSAWVLLTLAAVEVLQGRYRAVTLEPKERRAFRVVGLEKLTGSSGACVEEAPDPKNEQSLVLEATCPAVRTSFVWRKDGSRIQLMACAEGDERTVAQVALRKRLQNELRGLPSITACVREGHIELLGWALTAEQKRHTAALAKKYGEVADRVELIDDAAAGDR